MVEVFDIISLSTFNTMEFSILHDLSNTEISIKDCFVTNVFMYDLTHDRHVFYLRKVLRLNPNMPFLQWINHFLITTGNETHDSFPIETIMNYEKPYNALLVFRVLVSERVLDAYEHVHTQKHVKAVKPVHVPLNRTYSVSTNSLEDYFFKELPLNDHCVPMYSLQFPMDEITSL